MVSSTKKEEKDISEQIPTQYPARYRMASFNIRFDNAGDGVNGWEYRKTNLLEMLNYYSWDIIGLQEVCGNQLTELTRLSGYHYEGEGRDGGGDGEHCPIFFRKDIFEKEDGGTFWLSLFPGKPSKSWGADCPRICTWAKLRDLRTGQIIVFINTHLDHISEEARFQGAKLIVDWIRSYASDVPVIVTGDFNAGREERCYQKLCENLRDARLISRTAPYGPAGTFSNFDYSMPWNELKQIDYILTSRHADVLSLRTVVDSFDRKYPSDHFPVTVTVEILAAK
ncbi:Metal-dependent hydrolase, endonuclease/exonuclease/phosphatase family [Paenibacillus sophorae]|uniref:Metal-dependent hydrolase, endonuclease/exonuclease/phosphatase family n=2 Tax=Paenibacillus sophorae TaxID=1333845 RepID=A0A1H8LP16_9BACL|nr:Metal-dependent hydrolase, endonuclease/exonuclease/phosphatase family [Paenibacillus sophorae]